MPRLFDSLSAQALCGLVVLTALSCQPSAEVPSDSIAEPETSTDSPAADGITESMPTSEAIADLPTAASEEVSVPEAAVGSSNTPGTDDLADFSELQCSASAFVADSDPAGLNVRSGPSSESPVIDTLPTDGPVEATIIASANDWLKLSVAWSFQQQELENPGWVYAPLLAVTTRGGSADPTMGVPVLSAPDVSAAVAATIPKSTEVSLVSCSGDWLQVNTGDTVGWLAADNQCSSPVTTCP